MNKAICVHNISKLYRLGELHRYRTIRESLQNALAAPLRKVRRGNGGTPVQDKQSSEDNLWALRDVSFDVEPGEVVGIIGRNGAGKSTLLKILSRITEPTLGEIELFGRVSSLLEVGTGFHPELTGRENIYLNGSILGMRKAEIDRKFDEIVGFSGIERFLDTPVKRYSSGMNVRLAFAVAAHLEPEILLIDEVLAVGDAEFQRKCLGKMGEVARSGRTVLFVSHNMAAVSNLCQRGVLLENSGVRAIAPIDECVHEYLSTEITEKPGGSSSRYLEAASFRDPERQDAAVSAIPMGGSVILHAIFRSPMPTSKPRFGIVLRRRFTGEPVFGVNTEMTGVTKLQREADRFEVTVLLEELKLVQGEYVADLYLGDAHKNFQVLSNALPLRILDADVFGTGKMPYPHTGPIYVTPRIALQEAG